MDGLCAQLQEKFERSYQIICALFCAFHGGSLPSQVSLNGVGGSSRPAEELERDAVPTIQTKRPHGDETPVLGKRRAEDISPAILTSTLKKPRRACLKRESQRILLDFEMQTESALAESNEDHLQTEGSEENCLSQIIDQDADTPTLPKKETRSVGSQLSMPKPQRRSLFTQTKWKTCDKDLI